jgi:predicted O-linked N-acetylglucosamine transferase (SPINDLY family)
LIRLGDVRPEHRDMAQAASHPNAGEAQIFCDGGMDAHQAGDFGRAERLYDLAIAADPNHAGALHNLAILRAGMDRVPEAIELLQRAIAADPSTPEARFNLATVLLGEGQAERSIPEFEAALALRPAYPEALVNLGRALAMLGRDEAALVRYLEAEAVDPTYAPALTNIGVALVGQGAFREAGERFVRVLHQNPGSAEAAYNVANALRALGRYGEAVAFFDQALSLVPTYVEALVNRANTLRVLDRLDEAIEGYGRALMLKPDEAKLHLNLGQILRDRGDAEPARRELAKAIDLDPDDADARVAAVMAELPLVYADTAEIDRARSRYAKGLAALAADWAGSDRAVQLSRAVGVSQPFYLAYQGRDDRELQARYGAIVCSALAAAYPPAALASPPQPGERVRVGIVSGFFREHSNWKIPIRGWLAGLDRSRFQLFGYHTASRQDGCTEEAAGLCDRFVQGPLSVEAWRAEIAKDAPHVLIYPEVGMDPMVPKLAGQRLAPVQCVAWGHPDTSGLPTLDHFLSSELMEPAEAQGFYTETLVRLPGLGVAWTPVLAPAGQVERSTLGLRETATVYWCGQSLPKYLPQDDAVWPKIAKSVGDCQFVFIGLPQAGAAEGVFRARLERAFAAEGLEFARHCVFLPRLAGSDFLAAMGTADVFLDSLSWSGCNSTLESLVHDLPVVTLPGAFMRGRHSAAILTQMGVQETIAETVDGYVEIAVRLARDPDWRAAVSARMGRAKARVVRDEAGVRALEEFLDKAARA